MTFPKAVADLVWQLSQEPQTVPVDEALARVRAAMQDDAEKRARHEEVVRLTTALLDDALPRGVDLNPDILDRLTVALSTP